MRPGRRSTLPAIGCRAPAIRRSMVVFPPPFGPHSATTSPRCPAASTESSTTRPPKPALAAAIDQATVPLGDGAEASMGGPGGGGGDGAPLVTEPPSTVTTADANVS